MDHDEQHGDTRIAAIAIRSSDFQLLDSDDRDKVEREVKERLIRAYNLLPHQVEASWHIIVSSGKHYAICVGMLSPNQ